MKGRGRKPANIRGTKKTSWLGHWRGLLYEMKTRRQLEKRAWPSKCSCSEAGLHVWFSLIKKLSYLLTPFIAHCACVPMSVYVGAYGCLYLTAFNQCSPLFIHANVHIWKWERSRAQLKLAPCVAHCDRALHSLLRCVWPRHAPLAWSQGHVAVFIPRHAVHAGQTLLVKPDHFHRKHLQHH